jgi:hypothetical protein
LSLFYYFLCGGLPWLNQEAQGRGDQLILSNKYNLGLSTNRLAIFFTTKIIEVSWGAIAGSTFIR